jgi:hypothetical protein
MKNYPEYGERGETGEKLPKGDQKIDEVRSERTINEVGQGEFDKPKRGPMDAIHEKTSAKGNGMAYKHKRGYDKSYY